MSYTRAFEVEIRFTGVFVLALDCPRGGQADKAKVWFPKHGGEPEHRGLLVLPEANWVSRPPGVSHETVASPMGEPLAAIELGGTGGPTEIKVGDGTGHVMPHWGASETSMERALDLLAYGATGLKQDPATFSARIDLPGGVLSTGGLVALSSEQDTTKFSEPRFAEYRWADIAVFRTFVEDKLDISIGSAALEVRPGDRYERAHLCFSHLPIRSVAGDHIHYGHLASGLEFSGTPNWPEAATVSPPSLFCPYGLLCTAS
ncbi:MAG TPA: hypothetical protein VMT85_00030 [Thermoanaerobaculia bacterium]|nr:hypothetical protein [Thermoanaerobaculia bacterium]